MLAALYYIEEIEPTNAPGKALRTNNTGDSGFPALP